MRCLGWAPRGTGTGRNRRRDTRMVAAPGRSGVHSGADLWCCSDRTAESPRPDCRLQRAGHRFGRSAAPVLALSCRRGIIETLNANWAILCLFCIGLFFLVRHARPALSSPEGECIAEVAELSPNATQVLEPEALRKELQDRRRVVDRVVHDSLSLHMATR